MFFSSWLRKRHPIQRQTRAAVARRFRPAMEPLEDRSVPAVLNFMTTLGVIAPPQIPSSAGAPGELFIPPNPIVPPGLLVDLQRVDFAPGDPFIPPNPVVPPDLGVALQQAVDLVGVIAPPQIPSSAGSTAVDLVGVIAPPQIASSAGSTAVDLVGVTALPQMSLSAGSTAFEQGQFTNLGQPLTTSVGLDQLSELSELQSLRLQMAMDRTNVFLTTLSNLEGLMANTAQSIVGNLK